MTERLNLLSYRRNMRRRLKEGAGAVGHDQQAAGEQHDILQHEPPAVAADVGSDDRVSTGPHGITPGVRLTRRCICPPTSESGNAMIQPQELSA
jgi:hypothetical protein